MIQSKLRWNDNPKPLLITNINFLNKFTKNIKILINSIVGEKEMWLGRMWAHGKDDAPPSSLMDSVTSPKEKTAKGEGVGVRSLVFNISGVKGRVGVSK